MRSRCVAGSVTELLVVRSVSRETPSDRNNGSGSARRAKKPADTANPAGMLAVTVWPICHRGISLLPVGGSYQLELVTDSIVFPRDSGRVSVKSRSGGRGSGTGADARPVCASARPGAARHVTTRSVSDFCMVTLDAPLRLLAVTSSQELIPQTL